MLNRRGHLAVVITIGSLLSIQIATLAPSQAKSSKPHLGTVCPEPSLGSSSDLSVLSPSRFDFSTGAMGADDTFKVARVAPNVPRGTSEFVGRVYRMGGLCSTPLIGATVYVVNADSGSAYRETTDVAGRFDFRDLHSGNYRVIPQMIGLTADPNPSDCPRSDAPIGLRASSSVISDLYLWGPGIVDCFTVKGGKTKPPPPPRHTSIGAAVLDYLTSKHRDDADVLYVVEYGQSRYAIAAWRSKDDHFGEMFLTWGTDGWSVAVTQREIDVTAIGSRGVDSEVAASMIAVLREHVTGP